MKSKMSG
jgi:hypothetical protein